MITECYIKGRYDNGVGKCAVVIKEGESIVHQVAWKVPDTWPYGGEIIEADQFNCEILAATYAMQWCTQHVKPLVNLYSNLNTCQKWYLRGEFPESRKAAAQMFFDSKKGYSDALDEHEGKKVLDRFFADWISKDDANNCNRLVNELAENV